MPWCETPDIMDAVIPVVVTRCAAGAAICPNGAFVNSQGRKPLVTDWQSNKSPTGAIDLCSRNRGLTELRAEHARWQ
ncbi:MAG: hypothetical protein K2Y37_18180 [Pirellulales bacterium]|nr:hypothetical protein [Pirellulales bacterium]